MVKKGKPKPHKIGEKKEKILTPSTIALIALIIMVGSVIILPSTQDAAEEEQTQAPTSLAQAILENAPPLKMPMNDSEISGLLSKNRTVARFFYAPSDPTSKQAGSVLEEVAKDRSIVVDRINTPAQCGPEGAEYIKQYCPRQAPLTILYLPNGQAFNYPGLLEKEKMLEYLAGNFTPTIKYYLGTCDLCPPTINLLLGSLNGKAIEKELSEQEARELGITRYPSAIIERSDLAAQNYANMLNAFISSNQDITSISSINNGIIISPNPHALLGEECSGTEIKFFFSPSSPTYANETALLDELKKSAGITVKEECLPLAQGDADTCLAKYNQTQEPVDEARKYALTSAPAYVINANCRYERIVQKAFSSLGENASLELRKQACAFGNC